MKIRDLFEDGGTVGMIGPGKARTDSYQTKPKPVPRKSRYQTPPAPRPKPAAPPAPDKPAALATPPASA